MRLMLIALLLSGCWSMTDPKHVTPGWQTPDAVEVKLRRGVQWHPHVVNEITVKRGDTTEHHVEAFKWRMFGTVTDKQDVRAGERVDVYTYPARVSGARWFSGAAYGLERGKTGMTTTPDGATNRDHVELRGIAGVVKEAGAGVRWGYEMADGRVTTWSRQ